MIRFILGFCIVVAGVGAVEGTAGISTDILFAVVGTITMLWGIAGMDERNLG